MRETSKARVSSALTGVFVTATLLVAVLLIVQCADIYFTGTAASNRTESGVYIHPIYSREIVGAYFGRISWSAWLWLALLIAVLAVRQPAEKTAVKPPVANQLALLQKRVETTPGMVREQKKRKTLFIACTIICAVCAMQVGLYMSDLTHFASRDLEAVVGAMLLHVAPWIAVGFVSIMAFEQMNYRSMLTEIEEGKNAPRRQPETAKVQNTKAYSVARVVFYAAAAALLIAGVLNGGMRDVLIKAINICTECIGLG